MAPTVWWISRSRGESRSAACASFIASSSWLARHQRPRHAVMSPRELRRERQRVAILLFGLLEQPGGPQRVAVEREHLGTARRRLHQRLGLRAREHELRDAQRRLITPGRGPDATVGGVLGDDRQPVGVERLRILALLEEQWPS